MKNCVTFTKGWREKANLHHMNTQAIRRPPVETLLFYAILGLSLLPVLVCDYIVTADGPCHFYNSHILVRWLLDGEGEFYQPWLQLNQYLDPNWITNLIQIPLLKLFPALWAEKLFFALYLLVFSFGFRSVVREVRSESAFLAGIGTLFAWNYILVKGFTNNAWSIALWFWILAFWLRSFRKPTYASYGVITLLFMLEYLSHPVGLVFSILSVGCVVLGFALYHLRAKGWGTTLKWVLTEAGKLMLCSALPICLFISFFMRREWSAETTHFSWRDIGRDLIELRSLNILNFREEPWLIALVCLMFLLFVWALITRLRERLWSRHDGLLLLLVLAIVVVFNPPSGIAGGLDIGVRLGMFPFFCLLFWSATTLYDQRIRIGASLLVLVMTIGLTVIRLPIQREASDYAREVMTVSDSIRNQSSVLVLNYDWGGQNSEGKVISDRMWLFGHVDGYLGTNKDLILSDNYEANFWYFPLVERWQTNMYMQTDKDQINFDNRPPRADINSYKRRTGQQIDYVLMLSYRDEFADHPYTHEIFDQLNAEFKKVYTSDRGRAVLYHRKVY